MKVPVGLLGVSRLLGGWAISGDGGETQGATAHPPPPPAPRLRMRTRSRCTSHLLWSKRVVIMQGFVRLQFFGTLIIKFLL